MTSTWPQARFLSIGLALALGLALASAAACTEPRKLVLSIDTNAGVPCDIDRVRIRATASRTTTFERSLDGAHLPLGVELLDETANGSFDAEIVGLRGDTEVMQVSGTLRFDAAMVTQRVMLPIECTADANCGLSGAAMGSAAPPDHERFQCGPAVQRYAAVTTSRDPTDVCNVPTPHAGKVAASAGPAPVRLTDLEPLFPGFHFQVYGQAIHQIWVSRSGYVSFNGNQGDPSGTLAPGAFDRNIRKQGPPPPPLSVMAFWDKLTMSSGGVCYELDGAPGSQILRIAWTHGCLTDPCGTDNLNFAITLDESNQQIWLSYGEMTATPSERGRGATATVGLVDDATGCTADQCSLDTGLCKDGTPCGYSQVFSGVAQPAPGGVASMRFTPIAR